MSPAEKRPTFERGAAPPVEVTAKPSSSLHFDPETWITTARQCGEFSGVPKRRAQHILMSAHPVRWAEAAPSFFKRSEPGTWDPAKQKFEPLVGVPRLQALEGDLPQFQLLEFVEWDLQPLSKGGGLNVLEISEFKQTDTELAYRYRLIHCIQTKFLASWEPGGLDVDEGHYHAKWTRSAGGTLRIEAEKRLRYAREDEVMPGFSRMLNLLNPAMTSLLMSELAFYGVRDYLVGRPSPVRLALDKT